MTAIFLLSPAKRLDMSAPDPRLPVSVPHFLDDAKILRNRAMRGGKAGLRRAMNISDTLIDLTHARFAGMTLEPRPDNAKQALFTFDGDLYRAINADTLDSDALDWAQKHIRILSGLYGLLCPLDLIEPYRLEMGSTPGGKDLYSFWDRKLAQSLADQNPSVIVNLASNEYSKAVVRHIHTDVVSCAFHEIKNGKARPLYMYTRQARGLMARFAIDNRITDSEHLKKFDSHGYRFDSRASSDSKLIFSRTQPAPAGR